MSKIIGIVMVFLSCSILGFEFSARLKRRVVSLKEIKMILEFILRDVSFVKTPVSQAFSDIGEKRESEAGDMFLNIGKKLLEKPFLKESIIKDELSKAKASLCLSKSDISTLYDILNSLGSADSLSQKNMLKSGVASVENLIAESEDNFLKNEKTYKSAGVLLGIFIVVLFV